jgi:hypothetical protein
MFRYDEAVGSDAAVAAEARDWLLPQSHLRRGDACPAGLAGRDASVCPSVEQIPHSGLTKSRLPAGVRRRASRSGKGNDRAVGLGEGFKVGENVGVATAGLLARRTQS